MINSKISSSHHYYVMFIESNKLKNLDSLVALFGFNKKEEAFNKSLLKGNTVKHFQFEIQGAFGSEALLEANRSKRKADVPFYWYDFYIGIADKEKEIFFICYPYVQLGRVLDNCIKLAGFPRDFYKAKVNNVLEYMKSRNSKKLSKTEADGFQVDITKYTALVQEEANANKVTLLGEDPLNSQIFDVLNGTKGISVEATALKLRCQKEDIGDFEISFDMPGNFRFWLRRDTQISSLIMLKQVFAFFNEIRCLQTSQFISNKTTIDDE